MKIEFLSHRNRNSRGFFQELLLNLCFTALTPMCLAHLRKKLKTLERGKGRKIFKLMLCFCVGFTILFSTLFFTIRAGQSID